MTTLWTGKCSSFGGPDDMGVGRQEGLGLIEQVDLKEWWFSRLFLDDSGDFGLARSLNPSAFYCAMRFAYGSFGGVSGEIMPGFTREKIRRGLFIIFFQDKSVFAQAADWGPNLDTGRLIDCSPGVLAKIGATTDSEVDVSYVE